MSVCLVLLFGPPPTTEERRLLRKHYIPWAVTSAVKAKPLMNVWYEKSYEMPLADLRRDLNVTPAPPLPCSQASS